MWSDRVSDNQFVRRDELEDIIRPLRVVGDNETTAVDRQSGGTTIRCTIPISADSNDPIFSMRYDSAGDAYKVRWRDFYVPIVVGEPGGTQIVQAKVDRGSFDIDMSSFGNKVVFWLGFIDSSLELFWSYSGTATGNDAATTAHEVTSVNSKTWMGFQFYITENTVDGKAFKITGDNELIPSINFLDDLAWNYNSSGKEITIYLSAWNPGLDDGDTGAFSDSFSLGNSFSDRLILAWSEGDANATLDAYANESNYDYSRVVGSFATDSSGNLTHGWVDQTAQVQFGITKTGTFQHTESIEVATADVATFTRGEIEYTVQNGVLTGLTTSAASDFEFTTDPWTGISIAGEIGHKPSPVGTTSDTRHWTSVTWTTTGGISVDGSGVTSVTLAWDDYGHLWGINSTGSYTTQTSTTSYVYRHCTDYPTYPDILLAAQATGSVIGVDGECYEYLTTSANDPTTGVSVAGTFANCTSCATAATNEQWKTCPAPGSNLAVLSAGHTDVDYAWLCSGGVWTKGYNSGNSFTTASDPSVLKQCDATPTSCTDLVGWPLSDDYGGTGCNSGSTSDDNYVARWDDDDSANTNPSYSAGKLNLSVSVNGVKDFLCTGFSRSGDYYSETDISITSWGGSVGTRFSQLRNWLGATPLSIGLGRLFSTTNTQIFWYNGSTDNFVDIADQDTAKVRIRRSSGTIYFDYDIGSGWTNAGTVSNSSALTKVGFAMAASNPSGSGTQTADFDYITVLDDAIGSGSEIIKDPSGQGCT